MENPLGPYPLFDTAEFTLVGEVHPEETHPEGPFGDHYGYYSLRHDYPVFRCKGVIRRPGAIYPATVVGKPRQEDFFIGEYLQRLMSPIFPLVMPQVLDLWSYGETGFHSLASAVVQERYSRECLTAAFRILGEGQLSLTKFLLLVDKRMDLTDIRAVLAYILERADFAKDLAIFSNTAMDTLDYAGPRVNHGSKGVLVGVGPAVRELPRSFEGSLPPNARDAAVFCPGCLVVEGTSYATSKDLPSQLARAGALSQWPLIVLVDDVHKATATPSAFLWTAFTRFEPAADIHAASTTVHRNHVAFTPPVVIDARMKPWYPKEVECDPDTSHLVDRRWREYFSRL
jgi:3-polyprenyl-4-hydroxybenzoate decarboxylase